MGEVTFSGGEPVEPGQSREAMLKFISENGLLENVEEGCEWEVREGARVVGHGRILEILEIRFD